MVGQGDDRQGTQGLGRSMATVSSNVLSENTLCSLCRKQVSQGQEGGRDLESSLSGDI